MRTAKVAVATALVAGATFAAALPAGADVDDDSQPVVLEIQSPAVGKTRGAVVEVTFAVNCRVATRAVLELQQPVLRKARGAAVEMNLRFTCAAGRWYTLSALLNQRVGPNIATGSHTRSESCTGAEQRATFVVLAEDHPFRARSSYYRASIVLSPDYSRVDLEGEVQLVNG
ncbi:hypothetical protein [Saccharothrix xinjiangensis]|uniref:Uncharacterized protein n=1 Tax=Saccharothrix xinjiangensis TaxID=204798 RepID=A0ABV9YEN3_9PSEU